MGVRKWETKNDTLKITNGQGQIKKMILKWLAENGRQLKHIACKLQ